MPPSPETRCHRGSRSHPAMAAPGEPAASLPGANSFTFASSRDLAGAGAPCRFLTISAPPRSFTMRSRVAVTPATAASAGRRFFWRLSIGGEASIPGAGPLAMLAKPCQNARWLQPRDAARKSVTVINNPILNSPFAEPVRHWELDQHGVPSGTCLPGAGAANSLYQCRRPSTRESPGALNLEDQYGQRNPNDYINEIGGKVAPACPRRSRAPSRVTPVTARLLQHWRDPGPRPTGCSSARSRPPRHRSGWPRLRPTATTPTLALNAEANPDLFRVALKMATGSGKTTVMAMLIAWHTLNAVRRPSNSCSPTGS